MLSKTALFSAIPCPDKNCQRPHCKFKHEFRTLPPPYAAPTTSIASSAAAISQEEAPQPNSYVGYYNATMTSSSTAAATAYDPFATTYNFSSTSYAPEATSYSCSTDYSPAPMHGYGDDNDATTSAMQGYGDNAGGFSYDDDAVATTVAETKKRPRRESSEFVDPSKPVLPPELGDDEILQFGKARQAKESKKAKKPAPKVLTEAQTPAFKKDTEKANEYMRKVAELDRELDELKRKRKAKIEENMKKANIDVNSLFEDDEPPPKKISKPSTSTDSIKIIQPAFKAPEVAAPLPVRKSTSVEDRDVIVITHKPPPPPAPKGSRVAHQPSAPVAPVPTFKKKPLLKDQLEARMKVLATSTILTKSTTTVSTAASTSSSKQPTISTAFNKGQPRIAHAPKPSPIKPKVSGPPTKPTLKEPLSNKMPTGLRQRILDKLVDEFVKFMPRSDAILIAQDEEFEMLNKSSTRQGYTSSISGVIRRIREISDKKSSTSSKSAPGISHLDVLKGRHVKDISIGVNKHQKKNSEIVSEYTESQLYEALFDKYLMTDEQLEENGYPLWEDETTKEKVKIKANELDAKNVNFVDPKNPIRTCCRCKATYRVKVHPEDVIEKSDCVYHWGKFWKKKVQGREWIARWTCCDMGEGVKGCSLAKQHVTQQQTTDVFEHYVEAPPRTEGYDERSAKVYALDCEMVYTSLGPAVARLSVVDYRGDKILDEIIKPPGELLDTNFRFSGLEEDEVLNAKTDLAGAQQRFFELVNRDSILIGHSLESDLKAMRIVHKNVIDTSVLFPHRLGPPYKRALKNLSSEILMEIIQEDVTGHDSAEDAQIALKLVLHKLKNE